MGDADGTRRDLPRTSRPNRGVMAREVSGREVTVREVAMVLFRQRRVFLGALVLVLAGAVFYLVAGNRYQAHMQVLVGRERADTPVTAQENAPVDLTRLAITEEELNSEVELLKDSDVMRKVVEASDLAKEDWTRFLRPGESRAARVERAARRLGKKLEIESVKKTNLIAVKYSSADPAQGARVLQALAQVYLEKHKEVHRPRGEFHFFEQQTAESRRQLEQAENDLLEFTESHGIVVASQQRDLDLVKLSDADASYRQTQIAIAETRQRVAELKKQLATLAERTTTQVRTADNPELLGSLKARLLEQELRRTELLTKFEPSHRLVKEAEEKIAQTNALIAVEAAHPLRDETTDKDKNYEWARSELQQGQVALEALEAKASATATEVAAYQSRAQHMGADAIAQDDLASTEKAAEESYLLYVKKREEARMGDALDERGIVNVAIAEPAVVPALPLWSAWVVLAAGLVAGGATGTAAAFAADHLDPAFRTPEEVLAYLGTPVLASLPRKAENLRFLA
ncbi:MAG TPA: Wzz/FepE/Etk N-terminal domain-containing protein [Candidatus Sulfotelmatobacter sp.]|nr:Wzz/FepE/Etk N-terminal domain-containing protein [Candidatus Sulfotelmatobacter sp.]